MNKSYLIKLTDFFSFISLLILISTGTLLQFSLPPKSGDAQIWSLTRHQWGDVHFYVSIVFLVLMTFHLWLHIKFIKSAILGRASREHNYRLIIGVVGLILLIITLMAPPFSPVSNIHQDGKHHKNRLSHIDKLYRQTVPENHSII